MKVLRVSREGDGVGEIGKGGIAGSDVLRNAFLERFSAVVSELVFFMLKSTAAWYSLRQGQIGTSSDRLML